jgi:hypothetical protein
MKPAALRTLVDAVDVVRGVGRLAELRERDERNRRRGRVHVQIADLLRDGQRLEGGVLREGILAAENVDLGEGRGARAAHRPVVDELRESQRLAEVRQRGVEIVARIEEHVLHPAGGQEEVARALRVLGVFHDREHRIDERARLLEPAVDDVVDADAARDANARQPEPLLLGEREAFSARASPFANWRPSCVIVRTPSE